jgi:dTDP-4-amino-4,6-dideoxygalactose transaminase
LGIRRVFLMKYKVPFNKPLLVGNEQKYMEEALGNLHLSGDGPFTKRCNEFLEKVVGTSKAMLTTSCTHALEMCAILLNIREGDEVIVPSFAFVTTANAFVLRGAKPVFIDIRPDTLNLDERMLGDLITPKTKAIVALHYAGIACELDKIMEIARAHGVPVVEDNALGLFGKYKHRSLGSFGELATLSFHETKSFTCGEGGALLINEDSYSERAEILREKGTNRTQFFKGQVDKYTWVDIGSSYLPADILAAFLLAQLEASSDILKERKRIWEYYAAHLLDWAEERGIKLPFVPADCEHPYHMFYLLFPTPEKRTDVINFLKGRGIQSVFHYLPLHLSRMGQRFGYAKGDFPVAEDVSDRLVRLPFYYGLSEPEQHQVCEALFEAWLE